MSLTLSFSNPIFPLEYSVICFSSNVSEYIYIHIYIYRVIKKFQCIRTIPTQLMIKRWTSQNTFGMRTVLYWTRSSRTQFGVSINVWRLVGDTLNITCNFPYCNHHVHRDFLIILYYKLKICNWICQIAKHNAWCCIITAFHLIKSFAFNLVTLWVVQVAIGWQSRSHKNYADGLTTDNNKHRHQTSVTVSGFIAKVGRQNNMGHNVNDFSS
jgi:hypothetical protein